MPWKETCAMKERREFVAAALGESDCFAELCVDFGVSRKTGYKWLERYRLEGNEGLEDRRVLRTTPRLFPKEVVEAVLALRLHRPSWGPEKLAAYLKNRKPGTHWPSASTVKLWLRHEGLSSHKRRYRSPIVRERVPFGAIEKPNDVWCGDFKGWFRTGDRCICEPLTIVDGFSRYLLMCQTVKSRKFKDLYGLFEQAFSDFGYPERFRTDNGPPFGSQGLGSLSQLSVWLIKQGIMPEKTRPGHPEDNGRQERFHRTLKQETATPPAATLEDQQKCFDAFKDDYNNERPHAALGQEPPARHYFPDRQGKKPKYEYPEGMKVARVDRRGYFRWQGRDIYLSESLAREDIGVGCLGEKGYSVEFLGYGVGYLNEKVNR